MSAPQFDLLQCSLEQRTLIEASAGTGKTWNISGLYLRLLLEKQLSVDQVLVVTFTKAATAELSERIRSRIADMLDALKRGGPIADSFLARLHEPLGALDLSRDKMMQTLDLALQSFDQASIFTIHGFCQRALSETPFAAGMPFVTDLLQDDGQELAEVVNDFWRSEVAGAALPPSLAACLVEKGDSPATLQALLKRHVSKPRARLAWPADGGVDVETAQARLAQLFDLACQSWQRHGAQLPALLADIDFKASHKPELVRAALAECEQYFAAGRAAPCNARLKLLCASRLREGVKKHAAPPVHEFFQHLENLAGEVEALDTAITHGVRHRRLALLRRMLLEGAQKLQAAKREKRLMSYDDLLGNLHGALASAATPWLAEALRQRYPVALIDEFQDTDPLQFDIFDTIYSGSQAPLFLVGDPKQAIYSFRNADLHTYLHARQGAAALYTLGSNQRSSAGLINALNAFFLGNPRAFLLKGLDYQPVAFGEKPRLPFADRSSPAADLQVWMLPHEDGHVLDRRVALQRATEACAAEIARLLSCSAQGEVEFDRRPLKPGDIAVLVRSHSQAARIRQALAARGVASIEISQQSVFASQDAADVETLLLAIMEPARQGLLLAALSTSLMGEDAAGIAAIGDDEQRLMDLAQRLRGWRELWLRQGVGSMLRQFMEKEGVSSRLLARPDGERRMTNLRHLVEMLQQGEEEAGSAEAVLRWLQHQRRQPDADEAAQMRLESDRDLVQILTIHKSKGLEYPLVFCPYLWDGYSQAGSRMEGHEYHDDDGRLLIDFRDDKDALAHAKSAMRRERDAETLRLIYVALTRASHRCYLVAGPYRNFYGKNPSFAESSQCMLNWLVETGADDADAWRQATRTPAEIRAAWEAYAARSPEVLLRPIDTLLGEHRASMAQGKLPLQSRAALLSLAEDWRTGSFSSLVRGLGEGMLADHDALAALQPLAAEAAAAPHPPEPAAAPAGLPTALDEDDPLHFPRGSEAGVCMHKAFELADFGMPLDWPRAAADALAEHPQPSDRVSLPRQQAMLARMLADVLQADLGGLRLTSISSSRRLVEMEFNLAASGLTAAGLNAFLDEWGYKMGALSFARLDGYLKGFIDLVFEHQGRYYILDWKSNHLGFSPADYAPAGMAAAMREHGYFLQYLVYTLALHRYLQLRLPGYHYEQHMGGVYYLFVRGVRPDWAPADDGKRAGVWFDRPSLACITGFERLLGEQQQEAA